MKIKITYNNGETQDLVAKSNHLDSISPGSNNASFLIISPPWSDNQVMQLGHINEGTVLNSQDKARDEEVSYIYSNDLSSGIVPWSKQE